MIQAIGFTDQLHIVVEQQIYYAIVNRKHRRQRWKERKECRIYESNDKKKKVETELDNDNSSMYHEGKKIRL